MQPTHFSRQILLPANHRFIALTLVVALLFNMLPMGRMVGIPDWVALVLVFWCIHQPMKIGMGVAFFLGLFMDVVDGSVMGQHPMAYVLMAFAAGEFSKRILWFRLSMQMLHVVVLLLGMQGVMLMVRMMGGGDFPGVLWFLGSLTAVALWYPLTYLLLLPQYQPVERDDTRPI
ncbi:MAG: rod shape-determining protein MreD [Rhodocyclaceae bacterium]|nr:rod shape-determining protein MreD [Rhodocyclaceae bacterium]